MIVGQSNSSISVIMHSNSADFFLPAFNEGIYASVIMHSSSAVFFFRAST